MVASLPLLPLINNRTFLSKIESSGGNAVVKVRKLTSFPGSAGDSCAHVFWYDVPYSRFATAPMPSNALTSTTCITKAISISA